MRSVLPFVNTLRIVTLMLTYTDIIARWPKPSISTFARDIGVAYVTAQQMSQHDRINSRHWKRIVLAARRRGLPGITYDILADIADSRPQRPPPRRRSKSGAAVAA